MTPTSVTSIDATTTCSQVNRHERFGFSSQYTYHLSLMIDWTPPRTKTSQKGLQLPESRNRSYLQPEKHTQKETAKARSVLPSMRVDVDGVSTGEGTVCSRVEFFWSRDRTMEPNRCKRIRQAHTVDANRPVLDHDGDPDIRQTIICFHVHNPV